MLVVKREPRPHGGTDGCASNVPLSKATRPHVPGPFSLVLNGLDHKYPICEGQRSALFMCICSHLHQVSPQIGRAHVVPEEGLWSRPPCDRLTP